MTKKLTSLSDEQRAQMGPHARKCIEYGRRTTPLTEDEWATWEAGARKCYEYAGIPWPGVVVRVPSPMVGGFAAPIAASVIRQLTLKHDPAKGGGLPTADSAVGSAVYFAVGSAVGSAVDSAVGSAVRSAVGSAVGSAKVSWHYWFGGRLWCWWHAFVSYFRDVVELALDDDTWDRSMAYEAAMSAGYWWPNEHFVMVCDVPQIMHVVSAGGRHRLHCETGPAVAWDGWGLHMWHGTQVPADLVENGWDIDRIMAEPNTEIRRCAIEKMGWDRFIATAGFTLVDEASDPGNPGQVLRLYDVPRDLLDWPVRVLVCVNGSVERDGSRRTFGLTTPTDCKTALSATAWTYGLTDKEYALTEVRR